MKRHITWFMLIVLLIVVGLVGLAAAQQAPAWPCSSPFSASTCLAMACATPWIHG